MANIVFPTSVGFLNRPSIATLGDSFSDGAGATIAKIIDHARFWHYAADIDYNPDADGTYNFGVGGTTATYMLATELPLFQANPKDIATIWSSGYNEGALISASISAAMTNVYDKIVATAEGCLAARASLVIIFPVMPTAHINAILINMRLAAYARQTSGVIFFDCTEYLVDGGSTAAPRAWLGGTGAVGSATADGTHIGPNAARLIAADFAEILKRLARPRLPRQSWHGSGFSPSTVARYANVLGTKGAFEGDSGGLATGWSIQGSVSGVTFTPSKTVNAQTGKPQQKITISGTPAASGSVTLRAQGPDGAGALGALFEFEVIARLVAVEGLAGMGILAANAGVVGYNQSGSDASYRTAVWADLDGDTVPLTRDAFLYSTFGRTISSGTQNFDMAFEFVNGVEVSGEIYLEDAGLYQVDPIS